MVSLSFYFFHSLFDDKIGDESSGVDVVVKSSEEEEELGNG